MQGSCYSKSDNAAANASHHPQQTADLQQKIQTIKSQSLTCKRVE